ncbi:hypothetical protein B0T25DRAFT_145791 [Lasiosphaeria hispida]|uniref:Secreted protein n=1 Tax=Lasiosphaeria hispida TaxID=260671 RepID=A0AAJ0HLQ4_9PEZI|nr:hypothetical protein B0T25DRAFT_145791 [Lasiosphaeria hispida]
MPSFILCRFAGQLLSFLSLPPMLISAGCHVLFDFVDKHPNSGLCPTSQVRLNDFSLCAYLHYYCSLERTWHLPTSSLCSFLLEGGVCCESGVHPSARARTHARESSMSSEKPSRLFRHTRTSSCSTAVFSLLLFRHTARSCMNLTTCMGLAPLPCLSLSLSLSLQNHPGQRTFSNFEGVRAKEGEPGGGVGLVWFHCLGTRNLEELTCVTEGASEPCSHGRSPHEPGLDLDN